MADEGPPPAGAEATAAEAVATQDAPGEPLIELRGVTKVYGDGDAAVHALRGVDLVIRRGEAVAISGTSGSGKSTVMNLIGGLDRPTAGTCSIAGKDVGSLPPDELAALRNRTIGFIFQGFHLLPRTTATENVELPLIYAGVPAAERAARARAGLERVGLGHRLDHHPNQLSGGQQQRVAIARALVGAPSLILADEPTGNLDSATTEEVLGLLDDLRREGITIVCVTHEPDVAARFPRRIEFKDGRIVKDTGRAPGPPPPAQPPAGKRRWVSPLAALPVAARALRRHPMRTALTTLGIVIGTGAVVGMLAMGRGARGAMLESTRALGTTMVSVRAGSGGRGGARMGMGSVNTLTLDDAAAIAKDCPSVVRMSPQTQTSAQVVYGAGNWSTQVEGVTEAYLDIRNIKVAEGEALDSADARAGAKVCLLGPTVVREVFGPGIDPVGATIRVKNIPLRVKGVLAARGESNWGQDQDDVIIAPFALVQRRLLGATHVSAIYAGTASEDTVPAAVDEITQLLRQRHRLVGSQDNDFMVMTPSQMAQFAGGMLSTLTALLAGVACVSLLVGGIGIMNIMLVSVTERTREIGIRMAIGARGRDIQVQFLVEAIALSALGGLLGAALGGAIDLLVSRLAGWPSGLGLDAVLLAIGSSALIGVSFGFFPARSAARLDPIVALRTE